MGKKQIAWVLAAVLAVGTVTACAGQGQTEDTAAAATEQTAAGVTETEAAAVTDPAASETDGSAAEPAITEAAESGTSAAEETTQPAADAATAQDGSPASSSTAVTASAAETAEAAATASTAAISAGTAAASAESAATSATAEAAPAAEPAATAEASTAAPAEASTAATAETAKPQETIPSPAAIAPRRRVEDTAKSLLPGFTYKLKTVREVGGRQGIACEKGEYWTSGNTALTRYNNSWRPVITNTDPLRGLPMPANMIGDIDVYNGEIYAGVENYSDGSAENLQIAVYDAQTLQLTRSYACSADVGQRDCSGIAVDPDTRSIWMCSWTDGKSGRYLYRYSLQTGRYIGKIHLQAPPQWLQGIAYYDGYLYMTADDGTADDGEPDHIYRWHVDIGNTAATVTLERTLNDVTMVGEVEGLSFDKTQNRLLVSHNRGAQISAGVVRGYYDGYDREIHEIYVYDMEANNWAIEGGSDNEDAAGEPAAETMPDAAGEPAAETAPDAGAEQEEVPAEEEVPQVTEPEETEEPETETAEPAPSII